MKIRFPGGYAAAFLAVVAGWAIFASPWLSGSVTIPYDAKAHFQAQLQFLANALHSGQSPFWTHNVFGGSPQIADPQSLIFSPAFLLAYFDPAPSFRELDAYCFALLGLAAISVLMLFRDRGWHPAGGAVAALATAFGGSAIWRIQHIKQIESFAFFVLCLWLLLRALDRKSLLYGVLAGLAGGLMVIEPGQIALLGCYILGAYIIYHCFASPNPWVSVKGAIKPLAGGAVVGSIFVTVPIVFAYLFVKASNRPDIPFAEAGRGALHPASLLTSVVADLYGAHGSAVHYWGPSSPQWLADWLSLSENMGQVYIGALPILLILTVGVFRGALWAREIRFFSATAIILLVYALGRYTPAFRLMYDFVPGVHLFRRPADATYQLGAMLAILSGYCIHRLLNGTLPVENAAKRAAEGALLVLAFAAALGVAIYHNHLVEAVNPLLVSLGFITTGFLTLFLIRSLPARYNSWAIALVAAFMTVDLSVNNGPNNSTAKPPVNYDMMRVDTRNETIAFLKSRLREPAGSPRRDRVELVGLGFEWPNVSLIHGFDHVLGYNPLRLEDVTEGMGAGETVAEARQRGFTPLFPSYRSQLADLLGLRYIAIDRPVETIDKHLKPGDLNLVARTKDAYIYENPRAYPRVLFASSWRLANFTAMIKNGQWPDVDLRQTVLLDHAPASFPAAQEYQASRSETEVNLAVYDNTVIEARVNAPRAGFLVLNDVWHPWWYATVDGEPAEIFRANVLFRAVQLKPGKHVVRFEFRPLAGAVREIEGVIRGSKTAYPSLSESQPTPIAIAPGSLDELGKAPKSVR